MENLASLTAVNWFCLIWIIIVYSYFLIRLNPKKLELKIKKLNSESENIDLVINELNLKSEKCILDSERKSIIEERKLIIEQYELIIKKRKSIIELLEFGYNMRKWLGIEFFTKLFKKKQIVN